MTAKEQVLQVYPDAIFWSVSPNSLVGAVFPSGKSRLKLSDYTTEPSAWQSALTKINENGTTSNTSAEEA